MARPLLPLLWLFSACIQPHSSSKKAGDTAVVSTDTPKPASNAISYDTNRIAILPLQALKLYRNLIAKNAKPAALGPGDLETISRLIQAQVHAFNEKYKAPEQITLETYSFQYFPFTDENGDRKVYVNSFCGDQSSFTYWKKAIVFVDDGGSCFFQLLLNLTKGKCETFSTNGYA